MKRIVAGVITALLTLTPISALTQAPVFAAQAPKKLIVVIVPSLSNPFFATEEKDAVAEAHRLGYKTLGLSSDGDPQKQLNDINVAIADKASAIILDNAGSSVSISAVLKAKQAGIPSFLIDREINKTGIAKAQIVSNNYQGATLAGEEFVRLMHGKGNYVEIQGLATDTNAAVRSQGFHSVVNQYPGLHMVAQQRANWSQSQAFTVMQSILQSHKNIKGVWAGNDTMALGVEAALQDAHMKNVIVGGMDGSNPVRDSILRGGIKFTVMQPLYAFSTLAVEEANLFLKTGSIGKRPEKQLLNCILITKQNAKSLNNFRVQ